MRGLVTGVFKGFSDHPHRLRRGGGLAPSPLSPAPPPSAFQPPAPKDRGAPLDGGIPPPRPSHPPLDGGMGDGQLGARWGDGWAG